MISDLEEKISEYADADTVAENCIMALICPLGKFYPNKNFGNSITYGNDRGRLLASARQAVRGIDGVYIKSAKISDDVIEFTLLISDRVRSVKINLEQNL